ncbi:helicase-like transcription factor CHR28 isoform X2 [Rhodamnia argentea]|uniref:Helicase-like transcription factor CHR28 isoform X2 n=1 Tax=Rhodamnia argentea TaxID=178133 RepID=A0A8B8NJP9_9MYRT|nr:helicase-like transcription factor CHR28 isoform X2 [Rhodamnia argentea]XP_048139642.1 helicase-like transcription factor CHR28 isoform X2 [Rhodamnia argentea]
MTYASDHGDHLCNSNDSMWRCFLLIRWISRFFADLVCSLISSCSSFAAKRERCGKLRSSKLAMDPIEISSSDSETEVEDSGRSGTAQDRRVLPPWDSSLTSGASARRPETATSGSSLRYVPHVKVHANSSFSDGIGSSAQSSQDDDVRYFPENGHSALPSAINSRISISPTGDYERLSSQQALKRTLPSSFRPHVLTNKANLYEENGDNICINDINGNSSRPISTDSKSYMRDHWSRNPDDDVIMIENKSSRILPPSIMPAKSVSAAQVAGSSDPIFHSGIGDERMSKDDERLIYQAALEDLNQPKMEANLPDGLLSVPLLRHQKIALAWMLQKETRSLHCLGGILADDQGLGKTISMIALIQMQRYLQSKSKSESMPNPKTEALNLDDDDDNGNNALNNSQVPAESKDSKPVPEVSTSTHAFSKRRPAGGTLVVCPASVLRQWARELDEKVAGAAKLKVLVYHGGTRTKDPVELATYDVVVTTYAIVTIEVPKQPVVDEDDAEERNGEAYGLSPEFSASKKRKKAINVSKKGKKGRTGFDSSSFDCSSGALARVGWLRVILDEAQTIKNHRTQVARACCSLRAKTRWCLSGTPIQNSIDDLYSYFRFLRYEPYAAYKSFCTTIKIPISRNSLHGYKKLQAILRAIMLRRTKGTLIDGEPIITLPPKSICLATVDFSKEERDFYTQLELDSRMQFKAYAAAGTVKQNYANILLMLLRLRQACDHPLLVNGYTSDYLGNFSLQTAKKLPRNKLTNLLDCLETSLSTCTSCNDTPDHPVVTICGHVFCYQCVSEYLNGDDNTCPAHRCKEPLGPDVVFSKAILRSCVLGDSENGSTSSQRADKSLIMEHEFSSAKIKALLEILRAQCRGKSADAELHGPIDCDDESLYENTGTADSTCRVKAVKHTAVYSSSPPEGPIKAIVFSQWTSMLNLVEQNMVQCGIPYRRLDGTMTLAARDKAVKEFNTDPEVIVMLMSLKAGNLGLNMVAACHVILLDLWWNPTTEDQAIDRAHRIGQTRPVTVSRITIKDTVEDRILALQEEKRKMVASAFGEDQGGSAATRLTVEDLKYLFLL